MTKNFSKWFSRCTGDWISYRRYLSMPAAKDDKYTTEFTIKADDKDVNISWEGEVSEGIMNMVIEGDLLKRDIGYFSDDPTDSRMEMIDDDTIVFHSAYDGMTFREEIRLLNDDKYRLRQTVGYRKGSEPFLVGQYFEQRR
tara:strand:- start:2370 stop:2792 length:423 start_codon:yes stop_codon:yes gene_type:complete